MKLTVNAVELRNAANGAIAKRGTIPILEHVLLEAEGALLRITSSDLEKWLAIELAADIQEAGGTTCDLQLLKAALQGLEGDVTLKMQTDKLVLTQAHLRFTFSTLDAADFPQAINGQWRPFRGFTAEQFANAIRRSEYAMAHNDARYYLNGLALLPEAIAASNGHRIAILGQYQHGFEGYSLLVPAATVPFILKLLDRIDENSEVAFEALLDRDMARAVRLSVSNITIISKLIDSKFPDIRDFQKKPDATVCQLSVSGRVLSAALGRLIPFSERMDSVGKYHRVAVAINDGELKLEAGDCAETMECQTQGERLELIIDPTYLRDVAALAGEDAVTWSLYSPVSRSYFTFADQPDIHIIMPMR